MATAQVLHFIMVLLLLFSLFVRSGAQQSGAVFKYTRDQLLALSKPALLTGVRHEIPPEIKRRRRGCRAGTKRRVKQRRFKPPVPSVIMGNVRSLCNKMDELFALNRTQKEYRESSLMCFTETWLHTDFPDHSASIPGFKLIRADRDAMLSGKKKGGGIAVYVNERWCNPGHVTVTERFCSPDIELLAVSMRPYYLPREFSCAILIGVYIPPTADPTAACDVMHDTVARLQCEHPEAFVTITGDFNHVNLDSTLSTFHQFVDCTTRENRTLDLLYANTKDAYKAITLPPLGNSDHNLVLLTPLYVPAVKRQPISLRNVRKWSQEASETLQDCFEQTDWNVLCEPHGEDINKITDCITDYINFCHDTIIPPTTVRCYPNNKPWITSDLKELLNKKKRAFRSGDKDELKRIQRELKVRLRECKDSYQQKLESKLQQNNIRDVWTGMKQITGFNIKDHQQGGSLDRANELNLHFNRFSTGPPAGPFRIDPVFTPSNQHQQLQHLHQQLPSTPAQLSSEIITPTSLTVTLNQVRKQLEKVNQNKSAGPDGISPGILKSCAAQLSGILQYIFNLSLMQERIPVLWKTSCVVPVPKKANSSGLNDFRPIALTSHVMKVLEHLVLAHLGPLVKSSLDPLQFAYQPHLGADDAVTYLLQRAHSFLDGCSGTVRIMFFDFSSAFNTIQPFLLSEKLLRMGVSTSTVSWIADYLLDRPQFVRLGKSLSDVVVSNTGAPQGTVLSPFLFTLYTSDFQHNSESCHLQKFSDDSAVVGCIKDGQESEYRGVLDSFVEWCTRNLLLLNITKTKEMVVDFRKCKTVMKPVTIMGEEVGVVDNYKYLGVHLNSKLDWRTNTDAVYKKGVSRLYFLRKLRSFNVCSRLLDIFYQSVVASALYSAVVCWGSSISSRDAGRINKIIRKAEHIIGHKLDRLETVRDNRTLNKLLSIMDNPSHPLHDPIQKQRSSFSNRLIQLRCHKERFRKSFLPYAIALYNNSPLCNR